VMKNLNPTPNAAEKSPSFPEQSTVQGRRETEQSGDFRHRVMPCAKWGSWCDRILFITP